jgi:hypothetical protein
MRPIKDIVCYAGCNSSCLVYTEHDAKNSHRGFLERSGINDVLMKLKFEVMTHHN